MLSGWVLVQHAEDPEFNLQHWSGGGGVVGWAQLSLMLSFYYHKENSQNSLSEDHSDKLQFLSNLVNTSVLCYWDIGYY